MKLKILPALMITVLLISGAALPQTALADVPENLPQTEAGTFATVKKATRIYKSKSGSKYVSVKKYTKINILNVSNSRCHIRYLEGSKWHKGWISRSVYSSGLLFYDGTDKPNIADGTYTITPESDQSQKAAASGTSLTLQEETGDVSERFIFTYSGGSSYEISSADNGMYLCTETSDSSDNHDTDSETDTETGISYAGNIVLKSSSDLDSADRSMRWNLSRSGAFYYFKNEADNTYLAADTAFSTEDKSSAGRFRVARYGKNTENSRIFCQYDPDWATVRYGGKKDNIANSGCGILSLTNAVYALNGQYIPPAKLASYAVKNGFCFPGYGTEYHFFKAAAKKYGKTYGFKYAGSTKSISKVKKHLKNGGTVIAYLPGHYLAISEYHNGKYLLLDSYARAKRDTSPFGTWVTAKALKKGALKSKNYFLFTAIE